jgi:hypothetical protein
MTAPRDRTELVRLMADTYWGAQSPFAASKEALSRMADVLDALKAADCTVCPDKATNEMAEAANVAAQESTKPAPFNQLRDGIDAAIAASPYRRDK